MVKKSGVIIGLIILSAVFVNTYIYISKNSYSLNGMSIADIMQKIQKYDFSTIIFLLQWVAIVAIVLVLYIRFLRLKKRGKLVKALPLEKRDEKTVTDLDELYSLINEKKVVALSAISKTFKIDHERALEWCRILEEHNLVNLDYPPFSEPRILKLK